MSGANFARRVALRPLQQVRFVSRLEKRDDLKLFKDINRLARQGKWDSINNQPPPFKFFDSGRQEAYTIWYKLLGYRKNPFDYYAEGQVYQLIFTIVGFFVGVKLVITAYNTIVPEKYRERFPEYYAFIKHHLEEGEHHGHGEHH
ncbi:unnamed protein product [Bursaphelenchus xylophilus]|uniref:(pine wood nematode) hypothetical protein n=1 Tax=Bursaphelenchus xylophilus TaxID=6326 RepID=A0A1I7S8C1_BURXY|nr:unnamed protein product [Bursaphelenchus xylophilus]CAG9120938.1 unnamed protein product [Bursaphelenchus xylophilus]